MTKKKIDNNVFSIELNLGKIPFDSFPIYVDPQAQKMWTGLVIEYNTDKKYPIQLDWLEKTWIDDVIHYETNNLSEGDYIKISGGSHKNRRTAYFQILSVNSKKICLKLVTQNQVVFAFSDKARHLKREIKNKVNNTNNEKLLKRILKILNDNIAETAPDELAEVFNFDFDF